jgi:hypothetical protein
VDRATDRSLNFLKFWKHSIFKRPVCPPIFDFLHSIEKSLLKLLAQQDVKIQTSGRLIKVDLMSTEVLGKESSVGIKGTPDSFIEVVAASLVG